MSKNKTNAAVDTAMVFTPRMRELADFYRRAFDLGEPNAQGDDHLGFQVGDLYLGFDQVEEPAESPGGVSLWFRVDDLEATYQRLVEMGAPVRYGPVRKPWGDLLACVYDPDGNLIGLSQRG
jgi:predicted enzyme related to lactoylglutathione lyase